MHLAARGNPNCMMLWSMLIDGASCKAQSKKGALAQAGPTDLSGSSHFSVLGRAALELKPADAAKVLVQQPAHEPQKVCEFDVPLRVLRDLRDFVVQPVAIVALHFQADAAEQPHKRRPRQSRHHLLLLLGARLARRHLCVRRADAVVPLVPVQEDALELSDLMRLKSALLGSTSDLVNRLLVAPSVHATEQLNDDPEVNLASPCRGEATLGSSSSRLIQLFDELVLVLGGPQIEPEIHHKPPDLLAIEETMAGGIDLVEHGLEVAYLRAREASPFPQLLHPHVPDDACQLNEGFNTDGCFEANAFDIYGVEHFSFAGTTFGRLLDDDILVAGQELFEGIPDPLGVQFVVHALVPDECLLDKAKLALAVHAHEADKLPEVQAAAVAEGDSRQ
mmetsp:Transcript_31668/g.84315  ORF Transcript_31668/g.84315 Transcript_31668/m.84315 type:complete len:392 (+) Transcript_31668:147-1322(+)